MCTYFSVRSTGRIPLALGAVRPTIASKVVALVVAVLLIVLVELALRAVVAHSVEGVLAGVVTGDALSAMRLMEVRVLRCSWQGFRDQVARDTITSVSHIYLSLMTYPIVTGLSKVTRPAPVSMPVT